MRSENQITRAEDTRGSDLVLAVSISNLLLLDVWRKVMFADQFLLPAWSWRDLVAAILNVALLAALIYPAIRLARSGSLARFQLHRWLCLLPVVIVLNFVRRRYVEQWRAQWGDERVFLFLAAVALVVTYLLARWKNKILAGAEVAVLCMVTFLPLVALQTVWAIARQPHTPGLARPLPVAPNRPRVVWVVFDEMDWRYVYSSRRPADLDLPEMDRLRSEAFSAENTSQAGLRTILAMPSLITGIQVSSGYDRGKDHLLLTSDVTGISADMRTSANIFREARQRGINAGLVGWYMPYCRLLPDALTKCYWESLDTEVHSFAPDLRVSIVSQLRTLSPFEKRQRHEMRYEHMLKHAKELASDPTLGLVLLHMPVPHGPAIYDRRKHELTPFSTRPDWYLDNLALADAALGEIRRAMERAGLWETSTVLVSSDHSLRWYSNLNETTDSRIPFLLKLPGQHHGETYSPHVNAMLSHDLILSLIEGKLTQPSQLAPWFDVHERAYLASIKPRRVRTATLGERLPAEPAVTH